MPLSDWTSRKAWPPGSAIAVGLGLGVLLGTVLDNLGMWLALGVVFGSLGEGAIAKRKPPGE